MREKSYLLFLFIILSFVSFSQTEQFFRGLNGSKSEIKEKLDELLSLNSADYTAFVGAYKMKLASFEKTAKQKLNLFNEGKEILEKSIKNKPNDLNYRLLRLMIQENVPKILNYKSNIKEDKIFLQKNQSKFSKPVLNFYLEYLKQSTEK